MQLRHDLRAVAPHFQIHGEFLTAEPYGSGHINDTYRVSFDQGGTTVRYIFQRINHHIFKDPPALMDNIQRVTTHLRDKLAGQPQLSRRALTVIPTLAGRPCHQDEQGNYWRVYILIEQARTYDAVETPQQAGEAARAFGEFQRLLADLPAPRLHDTIPDFHHTPKRFAAFEQAVAADARNRAALARTEIAFAVSRQPLTTVLLDLHQRGAMPERITHNDTKLNNVLLDDATGTGICVIDLDTVMPGLALYDFGDMVRTTTTPAREDERDLSKVRMEFAMYAALVRGYLEGTGDILNRAEKAHLAVAGKLITFEIGLRFLTDFLNGDTYFKVHRDGHNLDRCRTQFKLIESIEQQEEPMAKLVARRLTAGAGPLCVTTPLVPKLHLGTRLIAKLCFADHPQYANPLSSPHSQCRTLRYRDGRGVAASLHHRRTLRHPHHLARILPRPQRTANLRLGHTG